MHNLFAKLVALGILVGGFALTGDLGWLAERGQRVIGAAEVASAPAMAFVNVPSDPPTPPAQEPSPSVEPTSPADAPSIASVQPPANQPVSPIQTAPAGAATADRSSIAVAEFRPPVGGPQSISLVDLRPGDRVVVWLGSTRHRCLVLDLVDPAAGGALVYEAAAVNQLGQPLAAAGPPRRVIVSGQAMAASGSQTGSGRLVCGESLCLVEAGVAASREGEWLGPIESLAIID